MRRLGQLFTSILLLIHLPSKVSKARKRQCCAVTHSDSLDSCQPCPPPQSKMPSDSRYAYTLFPFHISADQSTDHSSPATHHTRNPQRLQHARAPPSHARQRIHRDAFPRAHHLRSVQVEDATRKTPDRVRSAERGAGEGGRDTCASVADEDAGRGGKAGC